MVTCGTYGKQHFFRSPERLSLLQDNLISFAEHYGWQLQAWAIFSNHYHFIAISPENASSLPKFLGHLHTITATVVNELDDQPGRKVWFQYWDTQLTYEKSYLARLNYVHNNPVKHGLVEQAISYEWCSAAWFERTADKSFYDTVSGFKIDKLNIQDNF